MFSIIESELPSEGIIIAGDLTTNGDVKEADGVMKQLAAYELPLIMVAGNMDPRPLEEIFRKYANMVDGNGVVLGDTGFFGISGGPDSFMKTPYERSEEEIMSAALAGFEVVRTAEFKVLISHPPPYDTTLDRIFLGKHVGSRSVRKFVDQYQPDAVICGHIHESRGAESLGKSKMMNIGPTAGGNYAVVLAGDEIILELKNAKI